MTAVALPGSDLGETVALPNDARARAERIRVGIHSFIATRREIADAYRNRDWLALGYESWEQYVDGEFTESRLKLTPDERREAVAELRIAGMSQRAIGSALGVSVATVNRDLGTVSDVTVPERITGTDGKERPAVRQVAAERAEPTSSTPSPKPAPAPTDEQRAQLPEAILGVFAKAGPSGLTDTEVWARLPMPSIHSSWVLPVIQELADDGRLEPAGRALRGNTMVPLWVLAESPTEDRPAPPPGEGRSAGLPSALSGADESDASVVASVAADELPAAGPDPQAAVAAALDRFAPDPDAGARMWRGDLHAKLRPVHSLTLWIDPDDAAEYAADEDLETLRQLSLSFSDIHRRILAARNTNVVPLRSVR